MVGDRPEWTRPVRTPQACPASSSDAGGAARTRTATYLTVPSFERLTRVLTIAAERRRTGIWPYVQIARVDHWFKNSFSCSA
jgi:hypothetical protein